MVAIDAFGAEEGPAQGTQQDGGGDEEAAAGIGEVSSGERGGDEGEQDERYSVGEHPGRAHGLVLKEPGRAECGGDEDDGSDSVEPRGAAEEKPPENNDNCTAERALRWPT